MTGYELSQLQQDYERRIHDLRLYQIDTKDLARACVNRDLRNQRNALKETASVADAVLADARLTPEQHFSKLPPWLKAYRSRRSYGARSIPLSRLRDVLRAYFDAGNDFPFVLG